MTDAPERHSDTARNKELNEAVTKLDATINHHDPETDVPIKDGVWDVLDRLCDDLEKRAFAAGIEAAVEKIRKLSGKLDILACEDVLQIADELSALTPSAPAPVVPKVKPGQLERIVWDAMTWALRNPGTGKIPEYTDGGNSFAEQECRSTVRQILSQLDINALAEQEGE